LGASSQHPTSGGLSLWPFGLAFGIIVLLVGIAFSWIAAAVGLVITAVCAAFWVRSMARSRRLLEAQEEAEQREEGAPPVVGHGPPPERYSRAVFLGATTLGLSQVIGGIVTLPVLGFMVLPPFLKQGWKDQDIGKLDEFPEGKWIVATFMADPAQGEVSRKTAFVRNNGFLGKQPSYTIISNHCAHLGCPVQPSAPLSPEPRQYKDVTLISLQTPPSGFGCPCHGGQYDTEGNRTAGPPVRSLDRYSFSIRNGHLYVGSPFSVAKVDGVGADAKIYKFPLSYPGEPVDGLESWLYPIQPPH
jgi:Rieske Fe-S protein